MAFDEQRLKYLLKLFTDNQASSEEIREMHMLLRRDDESNGLKSVEWERIWNNIQQFAVQPARPARKIKWLHVAAAAIVITSIGTGAYLWNNTKKQPDQTTASAEARSAKVDVQPGGDKATLTLANGQQIILDNATNGLLVKQGSSDVVKLSNGELVYKGTGAKANEVMFNTLGTPRGGQYRLMLPDGSKVWLNAVSSIRYPTAFTGNERRVEITGEAYFEVTSDKTKPFRVICKTAGHPERSEGYAERSEGSAERSEGSAERSEGSAERSEGSAERSEGSAERSEGSAERSEGSAEDDMTITVLGTHFNVNAYNDEPNIKTTLVEGSVKITRNKQSAVIKPGEQTQLTNSGTLKVIHDANVDEAVAWRNGLFEFQDADLQSILRQVMRWYDVDVEYQGKIPDRYFTAIISREKTLTGVLEILKLSDIDYKLDGKKLVVTQ